MNVVYLDDAQRVVKEIAKRAIDNGADSVVEDIAADINHALERLAVDDEDWRDVRITVRR